MRIILLFVALVSAAVAQTPSHSITITWTDTSNPATGTTYTIQKAAAPCTPAPTFAVLTSGLTAKTFQDTAVAPGTYCYQVSAVVSGVSSGPATGTPCTANGCQSPVVPPFPVTGVTITVAQLQIAFPTLTTDPSGNVNLNAGTVPIAAIQWTFTNLTVDPVAAVSPTTPSKMLSCGPLNPPRMTCVLYGFNHDIVPSGIIAVTGNGNPAMTLGSVTMAAPDGSTVTLS